MVVKSNTDKTIQPSRVWLWVMEVLREPPMLRCMVERCVSVFWLVRSRCSDIHVSLMGNGRYSHSRLVVVMVSIIEVLVQSIVHGFVNVVRGSRYFSI
jgi:hypothetical protein